MSIVMSVNAGSSSLKFQVFKMPEEEVLAQGNVERIGLKDSIFGMKVNGEKFETVQDIEDHAQAVEHLINALIVSFVLTLSWIFSSFSNSFTA